MPFLLELVPGNVQAEGKIRGFATHAKVCFSYFYSGNAMPQQWDWDYHICIL
jgi:hypothetical protein